MSLKAVEEVSAEVPTEDFQALEEKVYRTIELYKAAKEARVAAERDVKRIREQLEPRIQRTEACGLKSSIRFITCAAPIPITF